MGMLILVAEGVNAFERFFVVAWRCSSVNRSSGTSDGGVIDVPVSP